jgi:hypothetical protein
MAKPPASTPHRWPPDLLGKTTQQSLRNERALPTLFVTTEALPTVEARHETRATLHRIGALNLEADDAMIKATSSSHPSVQSIEIVDLQSE